MPVSSDFAPHVGTSFRFGEVELRLAKVDTYVHSGEGRQPFTLIFTGPPTPVLAEGSYQAVLPGGGATTLYVIPIHTMPRERQDYQVVFN